MKNVLRCFGPNLSLNGNSNKVCQISCHKYSTSARENKEKHPYKKIHSWRNFEKFSQSLVQNVIYNKDGLVALNKPYGIGCRLQDENDTKARFQKRSLNQISGACDYSIANSLPYIAKKLGYKNLTVVRAPEKFMSGVTLLAADESVEKAIIKAHNRSSCLKRFSKTFWIVTTMVPKEKSGSDRFVLKLQKSPCQKFERPIIQTKWSNLEEKRQDVKLMSVEYEVLSTSTHNLSALIEMKASTVKWHAIRLFAATSLYSPILGDKIHGSRIQNIMGSWMRVNPFVDAVDRPPKINSKLLGLLNLSPAMQDIIPVHIHLKKFELTWYLGHEKDLVIEAPLSPEFAWTCQALDFKLPEENASVDGDLNTDEEKEQSVQISQ